MEIHRCMEIKQHTSKKLCIKAEITRKLENT